MPFTATWPALWVQGHILVVVIMEVYGLVEHIKEITRKVASRGYNAIASDLHHGEGPGDPEEVAAMVREA